MTAKQSKPQNPNPDYQDRDIRLRPLVLSLVVIALVTVGAIVAMIGLLGFFRSQADAADEGMSALVAASDRPPGTLLQVVPAEELEAHRAVERLFLEQHQWIDEEAGIARIPIERAMTILVERGLPVRELDD
jgi:hypothetical protein